MNRGAWQVTVPGVVRFGHDSATKPGEGNGNPLQYSCLENPMDGGAGKAAVHGVAKSRTCNKSSSYTCYALGSVLRALHPFFSFDLQLQP